MAECLVFGRSGNSDSSPSVPMTKTVTVHGAANETITFGDYSCYTDTNGDAELELPYGTYDPVCSVSNYSTTITIDGEATDIYCRPEGTIYWYGAFLYKLYSTQNFTNYGTYWQINASSKYISAVDIFQPTNGSVQINGMNYSKGTNIYILYDVVKSSGFGGSVAEFIISGQNSRILYEGTKVTELTTTQADMSETTNIMIRATGSQINDGTLVIKVYAIWA